MGALLSKVKAAGEDFEWYPTTPEIIQAVVDEKNPDDRFVEKTLHLSRQENSAELGEPLLGLLVQRKDYDTVCYLLKKLTPKVTSPVQ